MDECETKWLELLREGAEGYVAWIADAVMRRAARLEEHLALSRQLDDLLAGIQKLAVRLAPVSDPDELLIEEEMPPASSPAQSPAVSGFPKFFSDADCLLKVGWGEKANAPYRQRVPWDSVDVVVARFDGRQGPLAVRELKPLVVDQREQPGYHVDVAVEWLKASGWLMHHGHRGYTAVPGLQRLYAEGRAALPDSVIG
jgi:hypothetical protein